MTGAGGFPISADEAEERAFILEVYRWMTGGLALTGGVALYMAAHPESIRALTANPILFYGLLIAEVLAVFGLAAFVRRMSSTTASLVFLGYAALNGVTLSSIFLVYTQSSIANAFFVTAGTFAAMSLYGWLTKTDLTSMGNFLFMALIGLVIASFANLFFRNSTIYWITTYAGVLIFTGLTAYDTQKIKGLLNPSDEGTDEETKEAISGALALYLDFINLFLDILQIMGLRED